MSVRVDSSLKQRMAALSDMNWAEVIRRAVQDRLEIEEELRNPIDRRRALHAAQHSDKFRSALEPDNYDTTKEIRKWRDRRK